MSSKQEQGKAEASVASVKEKPSFCQRAFGQILLLIAILCCSLYYSIVKKLTAVDHKDGCHPGRALDDLKYGKFPPVLVIFSWGNFAIAIIFTVAFFKSIPKFKEMSAKDYFFCTLGATLNTALGNGIFQVLALQETSQNYVTILTRFEPILIMGLSWAILGEKMPCYKITGSLIISAGIVSMFFYPAIFEGKKVHFDTGELFALASMACIATSSIISKLALKGVDMGCFLIYRSYVGAGLFIALTAARTDKSVIDRFTCEAANEWMFLYAGLSAFTQLIFFAALKRCTGTQISLAISLGFLTSMTMAYIINDEVPSPDQYFGGAFIVVGLLYTNIQAYRALKRKEAEQAETKEITEHETAGGTDRETPSGPQGNDLEEPLIKSKSGPVASIQNPKVFTYNGNLEEN